ncbi:MAG TPA: TetR family transcriptional regulator [Anaeromyxobacteraceae bacterium]|nr:TetR family transcriptional regulator [Anaeromyxobacteraceae bacterium]
MEGPGLQGVSSPSKGIAARLWAAARTEFSTRGYHGARVQGIARRAGCNVALLYRHWASKRALYLDILKATWLGNLRQVAAMLGESGGAVGVVGAYLETRLADPEASQILVREYLDGGPFLSELVAGDPSLAEPVREMADALRGRNGHALRSGIDPTMAVATIGSLAALVAAAQEAARPFLPPPGPSNEDWKRHTADLLLYGLLGGPGTR